MLPERAVLSRSDELAGPREPTWAPAYEPKDFDFSLGADEFNARQSLVGIVYS